jgi:hypothetical protein
MVVNVLGLLWGVAMLVNFLWPRSASNPPLSALPNIGIGGALGNIPIFEATVGVIVILGLVYYLLAQRGAAEVSPPAVPAPAPDTA